MQVFESIGAAVGIRSSPRVGVFFESRHRPCSMIAMSLRIAAPKNEIAELCRRRRIRRLAFFGSVLRDDFGPDSDIDVLVEFESGAHVGLFKLYDMEQELSGYLGGRKVEINTPRSLSKYFRDEVLAEPEVLYGQA